MKVISTNIATPTTISWRGKEVKTGIYKKSVKASLHLGKEDVVNDHVIDRRYHGGIDKACYLYSFDNYPYWKAKYPHLDWEYGMFGENLTLEGFKETEVYIGSVYKIGGAIVQVSRPRQPCYKLGVRFGTQAMIKQFVNSLLSGVYVRVLQPGDVAVGDTLIPQEIPVDGISIAVLNTLMFHYNKEIHKDLAEKTLNHPLVSDKDKEDILKKMK